MFLILPFLIVTLTSALSPATKRLAVDLAVGTQFRKIPPKQARRARTGQKKIFEYTLYAKQLTGAPGAIEKVEFFPDFVDNTYIPASYTKVSETLATQRGLFETRHDCWGESTAKLRVTMKDGTVKTLYKMIRFSKENEANFRLTYENTSVPEVERAFGVELEGVADKAYKPGKIRDLIDELADEACVVTGWNDKTMKAWKVETDNSIKAAKNQYGIEIVSPILRGQIGLRRLHKVVSTVSKEAT